MTNDDVIELYKRYSASFQQYVDKYKNNYESAFDIVMKTVVREELSAGSDMTLGYYCPSPVVDLLIGNVHRGKILKRITKRSRPDHKYGFNSDNQMVSVINLPPEGYKDYDHRGFALYEGNKATWICFSKFMGKERFEAIVQAEYDNTGRIIRYTNGFSYINGAFLEIHQEMYTYGDDGMSDFLLWECSPLQKPVTEEEVLEAAKWGEKARAFKEEQMRTGFLVRQTPYYLITILSYS